MELCQRTHEETRHSAVRAIDRSLVARNWLFGWYIVEYEQHGADRAEYGRGLITSLSSKLKAGEIRGCSPTNLRKFREFYLAYAEIQQAVSVESTEPTSGGREISETSSRILVAPPSGLLPVAQISQTLSAKLVKRFSLGWSHYVSLLTIDNPEERRFYELEAAGNGWSVRELERQIASSLYERLALSRDKEEVRRLASEGQVIEKASDLIKNLNYFDRYVKTDDELPTIGIVLCGRKNDAVVELTLPQDANIYASKYQLYLPSKQELVAQLESIQRELHYRDGEDGE